ncbi:hypothetical protein RHSIM_Rhsim10G0105800 [Rhododendron simsii]|uniref:HAT C-terminal dimerisation domain-containing protein n=1 Tax=Rhododendron simsii TaxID=118357 RepID=A0A834GBL7_RHOSS|nr:hypothetical protein RHSIM_Rhsim10G0105800 [Rhododendron simsii]
MGSVGEEAASNIVGGGSGTGPLGSAATPAASTPAATNSGLSGSKRSRCTSWVWNHFTIVKNFKDEQGITTLPSSANVYDLLTTMYAKYDSKFRSNAACTAAPLTSSRSTNDEFWDFVSSNLGSSTVTSRIKLDKYLDLEFVDENDRRDFDVLAWWKKNANKYPVLSIMARDLLTPPVSTVASESAFSAGKRVLDERRSRLPPDILDCLICLKDWEDARLGIQKGSAKDEFRGYFADSDIDSD